MIADKYLVLCTCVHLFIVLLYNKLCRYKNGAVGGCTLLFR
jgi:hypothetical protein